MKIWLFLVLCAVKNEALLKINKNQQNCQSTQKITQQITQRILVLSSAYILFSFLNTFTYVFPAHWLWDERGFLCTMGAVDVAGCGPVHLVGGVSAMVATVMLKPRFLKYKQL